MSQTGSLWSRIRQARVFQVLLVYLGASWVVLQIADTLASTLELPPWVMPVAFILLLIGLVVILATAWVQSLPATTAREESGELPRDWQIAPMDALRSLRQGRLPHLTWGRSLAGGVVGLSLLFGGAGTYMGLTRGNIGPDQVSATEALAGIAVVPFEVRGEGLEIWREGMMDLLSNGLDAMGGYRSIDTRTVMARWQQRVGSAEAADLESTLAVARDVGARYALTGSVVSLGAQVRVVASLYDLDTGREVGSNRVEGAPDEVLRLTDELAVGVMRSLLEDAGRGQAAGVAAAAITTTSLPALRAFLEGEREYRQGHFAAAMQHYEAAVAEDSTFAIALVRLSEAHGWVEGDASDAMARVGELALAQRHRLTPRYQFVMDGWQALNHRSVDGLESLKLAVRKYPDDPEAWFLLAETYLHVGQHTYGTMDDIWEALQKASSLDPNFAPYLIHIAEMAVARGDRATAERTIQRYQNLTGDSTLLGYIELAIPLALGTDDEAAAALERAKDLPVLDLEKYAAALSLRHDRFDRSAALERLHPNLSQQLAYAALFEVGMGRPKQALELAADPSLSASERAYIHGSLVELWGIVPPETLFAADACEGAPLTCNLNVGMAAARLERWPDAQAAAERLRRMAAADSTIASTALAAADVVNGAVAWRRGDVSRGRQLLRQHAQLSASAGVNGRARSELAMLEADAGRPAQALREFLSLVDNSYSRPLGMYGAATMAEQMGDREAAIRYWTSFVTITATGEDLPRIREGREAMARLTREPAGQ